MPCLSHVVKVVDLWGRGDDRHLPLAVQGVAKVDNKGEHALCCPHKQTPIVLVRKLLTIPAAVGLQVDGSGPLTPGGGRCRLSLCFSFSHGELRTLADTADTTSLPTPTEPRNICVVVDATVDIHLTKRLAELPLHKALESGLTTQALGLWMAFRGMHSQDALHIVKPESHRYTYGNGRADMHAKHQNTNHATELEHVRLDTTHLSHLQHLPPIPSVTQPPHWVPEDTPYTDGDKQ